MLNNDAKISFVDLIPPRSGLMPPSTELLLRNCQEDIQSVLELWGIISYPSSSVHATGDQELTLASPTSDGNGHSYRLNARQQRRYNSITVDMLTILESSTKAIASIRTYSLYAPGLPLEALAIHRQAALAVIETLSVLEQKNRIRADKDDFNHLEEYRYVSLTFGDLEAERAEMKNYLAIVKEHLFKPQAEKIDTELHQLSVTDPTTTFPVKGALPNWIHDDQWDSNGDNIPSLGNLPQTSSYSCAYSSLNTVTDHELIRRNVATLDRCHDFLEFFGPDTRNPLPSPSTDKAGFLDALR